MGLTLGEGHRETILLIHQGESRNSREKEKQNKGWFFFFLRRFYYHKWKIWNKVDEEKRLRRIRVWKNNWYGFWTEWGFQKQEDRLFKVGLACWEDSKSQHPRITPQMGNDTQKWVKIKENRHKANGNRKEISHKSCKCLSVRFNIMWREMRLLWCQREKAMT